MKISLIISLLGGFILCLPTNLSAQFYSPKSRSLETYRDLPEIAIQELKPNVAADYAYVKYVAADTLEIFVYIAPWMSRRDTLYKKSVRLMPGPQRFTLALLGLQEGWYELFVYYKNRKISTRSLQIRR